MTSFNSALTHVSDNSSITAPVLVETLHSALSKDYNRTVRVDGQKLAVYLSLDKSTISSGTMGLLIAGLVTASTMFAVISIIITWRDAIVT